MAPQACGLKSSAQSEDTHGWKFFMNIFVAQYQPRQAQSLHDRRLPRPLRPQPVSGKAPRKEYVQKHWKGVYVETLSECDLHHAEKAERLIFVMHWFFKECI